MAVEFARQLKRLVDAASHDSRTDICFALGMVHEVVSEILDVSELIPRGRPTSYGSASEAIEIARAATEVYDACHVIEACLFSARHSYRLQELELPVSRGDDALIAFLDHDVSNAVVDCSFVYAVWARSPERCLYVGRSDHDGDRARGVRRRFDSRGKLVTALQRGSALALMLPSSRHAAVAVELEAAILSVLGSQDALPELNVRSENVARAVGSACLAEIGRMLGELGSKLTGSMHHPPEVAG
jgi:hypothetical protein